MGLFDGLFGKKESNQPAVDTDTLMNSEKFWGIIAKTNGSKNYKKQQKELNRELLKLPAIEILEFENRFRTLRSEACNWDFWGAAYIINGGCSDDCFSDFRDWLIGQGKSIFENALTNIESLSELTDTNDGDWEGLGYVPTEAYEKKTRNNMPNGMRETFDIAGEQWEEEGDDLKNRYPKLWAKFAMD